MRYRVKIPITGYIEVVIQAESPEKAINNVVNLHPENAHLLADSFVWAMQEDIISEDGDCLAMLECATANEVI